MKTSYKRIIVKMKRLDGFNKGKYIGKNSNLGELHFKYIAK